MPSEFSINLTGEKDLIDALKKLSNRTAVATLKKALRKAGHKIKTSVKNEAPEHTGNLKKSITVYDNKGRVKGALIRVGAATKFAPHAHLVEFGTDEVRTSNKLPKLVKIDNENFFMLKHTGKMPANNFFERGYESAKQSAIAIFESELKKAILK